MARKAKVDILIDIQSDLKELKGTVAGMKNLEKSANSVGQALKTGLGVAVGERLLRSAERLPGILFQGAKAGFAFNQEMEQVTVAFETMLKSRSGAEDLVEEIKSLAASTPLATMELNRAAKSLLAFGSSASDLPDELRMIGDISSAIGAPINSIAEIYGKARVQGRLFMEDINQLTGRGIPVIGALAEQFGVAESEIRGMVEDGEVGFDHIQEAFEDMTSEGGQFFNMMEKQSKTIGGKISTLGDLIEMRLGKVMEETFANSGGYIDEMIAKLENGDLDGELEEIGETVAVLAQGLFEMGKFGLSALTEIRKEMDHFGEALGNVVYGGAWEKFEGATAFTPMGQAGRAIGKLTNKFGGLDAQMEASGRAADEAEARLAALRAEAEEGADASGDLADSQDDVADAAKKAAGEIDEEILSIEEISEAIDGFRTSIKDLVRDAELDEMTDGERFAGLTKDLADATDGIDGMTEGSEEWQEQLKRIKGLYGDVIDAGSDIGMSVGEVQKMFSIAKDTAKKDPERTESDVLRGNVDSIAQKAVARQKAEEAAEKAAEKAAKDAERARDKKSSARNEMQNELFDDRREGMKPIEALQDQGNEAAALVTKISSLREGSDEWLRTLERIQEVFRQMKESGGEIGLSPDQVVSGFEERTGAGIGSFFNTPTGEVSSGAVSPANEPQGAGNPGGGVVSSGGAGGAGVASAAERTANSQSDAIVAAGGDVSKALRAVGAVTVGQFRAIESAIEDVQSRLEELNK